MADEVFIKAISNTLLIAVVTGPIGFIAAFVFAWLINDLHVYIRTFVVLVFYAPSIAGNAYMIWQIIFSGAHMVMPTLFIGLGITDEAIQWFTILHI